MALSQPSTSALRLKGVREEVPKRVSSIFARHHHVLEAVEISRLHMAVQVFTTEQTTMPATHSGISGHKQKELIGYKKAD